MTHSSVWLITTPLETACASLCINVRCSRAAETKHCGSWIGLSWVFHPANQTNQSYPQTWRTQTGASVWETWQADSFGRMWKSCHLLNIHHTERSDTAQLVTVTVALRPCHSKTFFIFLMLRFNKNKVYIRPAWRTHHASVDILDLKKLIENEEMLLLHCYKLAVRIHSLPVANRNWPWWDTVVQSIEHISSSSAPLAQIELTSLLYQVICHRNCDSMRPPTVTIKWLPKALKYSINSNMEILRGGGAAGVNILGSEHCCGDKPAMAPCSAGSLFNTTDLFSTSLAE